MKTRWPSSPVLLICLVSCAATPPIDQPVTLQTQRAEPQIKPLPSASVDSADNSRSTQASTSDAETFASEVTLVETLLTRSSAAGIVLASGDAAAIAELDKAKQLLQTAKESATVQAGRQRLFQAKQLLFAASRAVSTSPAQARQNSTYPHLVKTARIFLQAYARIRQDKSISDDIEPTAREMLERAEDYFQRGDTKNAEQLAGSAFHLVREAIVGLRNGDTLIRNLTFDSPLDEYHYELDRNQTHQMLVRLLVQKTSLTGAELENIQHLLLNAQELRQQAEHHAAGHDYPSAITALEKSTEYIIVAIRAAGIYIPG